MDEPATLSEAKTQTQHDAFPHAHLGLRAFGTLEAELYGWPSPAEVHDKPNDEQNQEDKEQDLSDPGGCERNTSEAKDSCNDCNNKKNQRVPQHPMPSFSSV